MVENKNILCNCISYACWLNELSSKLHCNDKGSHAIGVHIFKNMLMAFVIVYFLQTQQNVHSCSIMGGSKLHAASVNCIANQVQRFDLAFVGLIFF